MKVKEAIKLLKEQDPEAEVVVTSSNLEHKNNLVSAEHISSYNSGMKRVKEFNDAFDNTAYSKPIWNLYTGSENVVFIDG